MSIFVVELNLESLELASPDDVAIWFFDDEFACDKAVVLAAQAGLAPRKRVDYITVFDEFKDWLEAHAA